MEQSNTPNPGKGLGVTGFVLALIGIVGGFIVSGIAVLSAAATGGGMGLAIGWTVFCVLATVLSFMGMSKSKAAGHKAGLAMGGLVIGIVAVLYCAYMMWAVHQAQSLNTAFEGLGDALKDAFDSAANHMGDSMH